MSKGGPQGGANNPSSPDFMGPPERFSGEQMQTNMARNQGLMQLAQMLQARGGAGDTAGAMGGQPTMPQGGSLDQMLMQLMAQGQGNAQAQDGELRATIDAALRDAQARTSMRARRPRNPGY